MNLFSPRHQLNPVKKNITINNNNNNNNNNDVISSVGNKFTTSDHAVISKGNLTGSNMESDIVMVTYTFNGTSKSSNSSTSTLTTTTKTSIIQGSINGSTLPMRLRITGDRLILLRKESEIHDVDGGEDDIGSLSFSENNGSGLIQQQQKKKIPLTGNGITHRPIEEYRTVKLIREKSTGFGLSIKGGCEHGLPILISGLTKDGPADRSRQLFIGDAIVRIDNTLLSLTTTTHEEAIRLLKQAGVEVNLTVKHFKMVSPFLTKCWKKRQTLDDEAGNLMVSTTATTTISTVNNNEKQEKGKKLLEAKCNLKVTKVNQSSGKLQTSSSTSNCPISNNNNNSDKNNNYGKDKGKVKKVIEESVDDDKWIPLISIDLGCCFVTKYIHDSDKIRPQSFEIRWLINGRSNRSSSCCPSTSSSSSSSSATSSTTTSSGTSSSSSSTTSLSTPKSTDSGVGVGIKCSSKHNNNSTITSMGNFKEPLSLFDNKLGNSRLIKTYSSAIVICNSQTIYSQWFNNIEKSVKNVTNHQMDTLNQHLPGNEKILFMGWINQGLPSTSSEPHRPCYHWYTRYLVIKGGDALIYIKPPQGLLSTSNDNNSFTNAANSTKTTTTTSSSSSSFHPNTIRWSEGQPYLFKAHQSVLRCLNPNEYVDERENCFLLLSCDTNYSLSSLSSSKTATKSPLISKNKTSSSSSSVTTDHHSDEKPDLTNNPIVTETSNESTTPTTVCYFSVETPNELALIRNNWNRATYQSVTQLGSKSFPVTCSDKLGSLILDYRFGFTFTTGHHHPTERNHNKQHNWSFKFSQLKTSSDDGNCTLWLSFRVPMVSTSSSPSTSSRYEINHERLRRSPINPNHPVHGRSSETLTHSSTSSITVASDNPNLPPTSSSSSSSSAGLFLSSTLNHQQQSELIGKQISIETKEIKTNQLQHLLYCIHAFLTAKVISVDQSFIC